MTGGPRYGVGRRLAGGSSWESWLRIGRTFSLTWLTERLYRAPLYLALTPILRRANVSRKGSLACGQEMIIPFPRSVMTTACVRFFAPSFRTINRTWCSTVRLEIPRARPISPDDAPSANRPITSISREVRLCRSAGRSSWGSRWRILCQFASRWSWRLFCAWLPLAFDNYVALQSARYQLEFAYREPRPFARSRLSDFRRGG